MKIYGIARIQLTISQVNFDESAAFYHALMADFFEGKLIVDHPDLRYWVAGTMAFAIIRSSDRRRERASQDRVGLHHVCFRARSRKDVDRAAAFVRLFGDNVVFGPGERPYAPGAYAVEFTDADGIHMEISHFPGKGYLDETITIPIPRPQPR